MSKRSQVVTLIFKKFEITLRGGGAIIKVSLEELMNALTRLNLQSLLVRSNSKALTVRRKVIVSKKRKVSRH